ncbi:MAG: hydrogenase iron-sulfur subunit [Deltaproteobacteria bacterium]|jgi:coenzyme F420-reducing hydrogenase delta subunit|nr:hydrogenase iron-sulfur subunit [Deltaproteobacteria bacterium]MCK5514248.1 hydrogenase iron-sulfur subunit [Deltaproteobacteria bacterium]NOQ85364.1 hydrogenase iron-sulfur subunit [Deltaproteobacteria bacterium]
MSEFEPNIVAFLCNWCSYAGADLTGTTRTHYPPTVKVIRVMCTGRVNPLFVLQALRQGADGVLISGCHPGECHYLKGNFLARRRFLLMKNLLEYIGINPSRIRMSWVSASEGKKFADVITEVTEDIKKLGPLKSFKREIL